MARTLHVHIGSTPDRSELAETMAAIDDGEDVSPRPSRLAVESLETFHRIFRPTNLELLEAIAERDPESIRALARHVDRHPPEVTDNVTELANYGLIELEREGRAKRPTVWYDEIEVAGGFSLHREGSDVASA